MPDQQLDLTTWLAELEADRAKLDLMIAEVRRRLGQPSADNGGAPVPPYTDLGSGPHVSQTGRVRGDEFFRMSIPEATKRFLAIMKQPQTPKAIVDGLKAGGIISNATHFYANVFTTLKRLRLSGDVVNTTNGWGLSEWYPNKPKLAEKPKKKGRKTAKRSGEAKPAQPSAYRQFLSEQLKAGKTMADAAQEWRKQHGEEGVTNGAGVKALFDR